MNKHVEPAPVSRITGSTAPKREKIVVINTDRSYFRGFLFFASAPLIGLAIIVATFAVGGHMVALFDAGFWVSLIFPLAPFLFVGLISGAASLRGTMIGRCTWLGGLAPVLALEFMGLLVYGRGIRNHAGTGDALVFAMSVCAALPASIVGSLIGLRIGSAISNRQNEGCDLRLMSSVQDARNIPTGGKDLIIVAAVENVLHFRVFDGDGNMVVDTDEKRLKEQARQIEDLRRQLVGLWPLRELTTSEKGHVITAVTSIVGHTQNESTAERKAYMEDIADEPGAAP